MEPQPPEVRNYSLVLEQIKREVVASRHRAALAVNSRMVFLYWQIGRKILEQQTIAGWEVK